MWQDVLQRYLLILSNYKRLTNRNNLALILIIAVAFLVRSWDLGWNGFNGDESIYSGQAASLLGDENSLKDFVIFRSHPILLQSLVSIAFALFGIYDIVARIVPVIFGTLSVLVTYLVGKELFDRKVGIISCLILALLPFHIIFSRQVLVDVPLSFFLILFIYFIAKYRMTGDNMFCFWAGVSSGLCVMSKEVGVITIPIFIVYTFLTHTLELKKFLIFLAGCASAVMPFFFLLLTRHDAMNSFYYYAIWQTTRKADIQFQEGLFEYFNILLHEATGYILPLLLGVSIFLLWKESKDRKVGKYRDHIILLLLTLGSLFTLYSSIATQADRFVITFIPPILILGCAFIASNSVKRWGFSKIIFILIIPMILLSNNYFLNKIIPVDDLDLSDHLGTSWKREAALWIKNNTAPDAGVLTYSNSFANTIRFYTINDVYAAEDNFNPAYSIVSPILLGLNNNITIIVDDLTAEKHSIELNKYIDFLNPKLVHTILRGDNKNGTNTIVPAIKIYQLR